MLCAQNNSADLIDNKLVKLEVWWSGFKRFSVVNLNPHLHDPLRAYTVEYSIPE